MLTKQTDQMTLKRQNAEGWGQRNESGAKRNDRRHMCLPLKPMTWARFTQLHLDRHNRSTDQWPPSAWNPVICDVYALRCRFTRVCSSQLLQYHVKSYWLLQTCLEYIRGRRKRFLFSNIDISSFSLIFDMSNYSSLIELFGGRYYIQNSNIRTSLNKTYLLKSIGVRSIALKRTDLSW